MLMSRSDPPTPAMVALPALKSAVTAADTPMNDAVSVPSVQQIVAAAPYEHIVACAANQYVAFGRAKERIREGGAGEILDAGERVSPFTRALRAGDP